MENEVRDLLLQARRPQDLDALVLSGVIGMALKAGRKPLIRGLSEARFQKLLNEYFIGVSLENGSGIAPRADNGDEFNDLVELLLDNRTRPCEPSAWLSYAVASAAMGENHLWQDMGLPNRRQLSEFLKLRFAPLADLNTGDMKWKKFFYRQLCERAGVPVCRSPHCADCADYGICFGSEDEEALPPK
ncbi:MAG TPA: nitrogen fixation protein NifQ [Rhodocyclaceae bacterium]